MNFYVYPELVDYEGVVTQAWPLLARFELDRGKVLLYASVSMATGSTVHISRAHALCRTSDRRTVLVCCEYSSVKIANSSMPAQGLKVGFRGLLWLHELSLLLQRRHQLHLHNNPTLLANVIDFFFGNQKEKRQSLGFPHKCSAFDEAAVPSSIGSVCEVVSSVQESAALGQKFTVATSDDRLLLGMLSGGRLGDAGSSLPLLTPPLRAAGGLVALQNWVLVEGKQLRAQHLRLLEEGSLEQQMEALSLHNTQEEKPFHEICSIKDLYTRGVEECAFTGFVLDSETAVMVLGDASGASVRAYGVVPWRVPGSRLRLCPLRVRTSCSTGALYLQATPHTRITHWDFPLSHVFRRLLWVDRVESAEGHSLTVGAGAWRAVCCGAAAKQISHGPFIAAHCLLLHPQTKTLWCVQSVGSTVHRAALQLYADLYAISDHGPGWKFQLEEKPRISY